MEYRVKGNEIILKVCPFCGNAKWNMQINVSKGLYHDWACGAGGSIRKLLALFPAMLSIKELPRVEIGAIEEGCSVVFDDSFVDLLGSGLDGLVEYIFARGFDRVDIIDWKVRGNERNELLFPLYKEEELVYYVIKDVQSGAWYMPAGVSKKLILWYRLKNDGKDIILVEGVFDAMKVWKAGLNVLVLLGLQVFPVHVDFLRNKELHPVLFLDADVKYIMYERIFQVFESVDIMKCPKDADPADLGVAQIRQLYLDKRKVGLSEKLKLRWI